MGSAPRKTISHDEKRKGAADQGPGSIFRHSKNNFKKIALRARRG